MADDDETVGLRLLWVDLDETPVRGANALIGQIHEDEILLSFGSVSPPILLGTIEERRAQASGLGYVPVLPIARLQVTRSRLAEFIRILEDTARNYDTAHGEGQTA